MLHLHDKPLLLCDVDGVISLWGFPADDRPAGRWQQVDGIAHFLSAEAGRHLLALLALYELWWCTGWEEKANDYLPLALGLPGSHPFIRFDRSPGNTGAHWKLASIDAHVGRRPVAWIDDALDERCERWAAGRRAPTLLVHTEPAVGLGAAQAEVLRQWALALREGP